MSERGELGEAAGRPPEPDRLQPVRLQKVLAAAGVGSRRRCEELIRQGRVAVDGQVVAELGVRVRPDARITVDGQPVGPAEQHVYLLLHKPPGYVSTAHDPEGRPTVLDLAPGGRRLYPVGRLDYDSEGLLLLTNDGELADRLLHPSHEVEREYHVLIAGEPAPGALRQLAAGVELDGRLTAPASVGVLRRERGGTWLRVVIHEGRRRQVRRACEVVGLAVCRLIRVRLGPLSLGALPPGRCRPLRPEEVAALRRAAEPPGG